MRSLCRIRGRGLEASGKGHWGAEVRRNCFLGGRSRVGRGLVVRPLVERDEDEEV